MPPKRDRLVAVVAVFFILLMASAGCRSPAGGAGVVAPPMLAARPPAGSHRPLAGTTLAPQTVVRWSVASPQAQRSPAIVGRDVVAADGTLTLGPYGSVPVAGLTVEQAQAAAERHVARQFPEARVNLQVESPTAPGPLQRLFGRTGETTARPDASNGWQYSKQPSPAAVRPASLTQPAAPPADRRPAPTREPVSQQRGAEQRIRPVSASEPEVAPMPQVLAPQPPIAPHGGPVGLGDQPVPRELAQVSLPPYVIDPPDILLIESTQGLPDAPIRGQHLVRPDGTVSLGIYGSVYVAGMTIPQAHEAIARVLAQRIDNFDRRNLHVDVLAYNSKFYYVITDGAGYGEQVVRVPVTGNETVLDAISLINGLPPVASKKHIWVARRTPNDGSGHQILPVDWVGITQRGSTVTNYQILPGDRIYVQSDHLIRFDNRLTKVLNPIERLLGVTLLGSATVNSIAGRGLGGTGGIAP